MKRIIGNVLSLFLGISLTFFAIQNALSKEWFDMTVNFFIAIGNLYFYEKDRERKQ